MLQLWIVPRRTPVTVVVGSPIPVTKNENPTSEDISQLQDKYIEELTKLYKEHNPYPDVILEIH